MMQAKLLFFADSTLLEGPVWDEKNGLIYCVSIEQNQVYAIHVATGRIQSYTTKGNVGCIAIQADGTLLVAEKTGIYRLNVSTGERAFITGDYSQTDMRYNDGKLDPDGTFLVGIKGDSKDYPGEGALFKLEGGKLTKIIDGTTIANGLGFNRDGTQMYFIDTPKLEVSLYDYHLADKMVCYVKPIVQFTEGSCPDGMCVDTDGNLWVAEWGGSKVCKWDAITGKKLAQIDLPVTNVTSCCLGGENLDCLFITTAKSDKYEPLAGGLFVAKIR